MQSNSPRFRRRYIAAGLDKGYTFRTAQKKNNILSFTGAWRHDNECLFYLLYSYRTPINFSKDKKWLCFQDCIGVARQSHWYGCCHADLYGTKVVQNCRQMLRNAHSLSLFVHPTVKWKRILHRIRKSYEVFFLKVW